MIENSVRFCYTLLYMFLNVEGYSSVMVCDHIMIINLFSAPLSQGRFFQNQISMRRETNMKKQNAMKRIFSMLLCLCMMVSYLPVVAHAAETACICTTACTEDSIDTDCPVCGVEGADLENCTQHSHTQEQEPLETTTPTETVEETLESTMGSTVPKTTDATGGRRLWTNPCPPSDP